MMVSAKLILDKLPRGHIKADWQWRFLLGFFFILTGTIGLLAIPLAALSTITLFSFFMILSGVFQLIEALKAETGRETRMLHLIAGGLYVVGGVIALSNPVAASQALTFLLAVVICAAGLCRVVTALLYKKAMGDWGTILTSGLESVAIAFLIGISWPYSSLWTLGLFISADLILNGWSHVVTAFEAGQEDREKEQTGSAAEPGFITA